jgi:biotin carboxyl carrier protein
MSHINEPDLIEVQPGVWSFIIDNRVYEAFVDGNNITISGQTFDCTIDDPRQWKRTGSGAGASGRASIVAPMPGKVVRILVAAGDEVTAGQGIVVVEAMKMQNEMKAPRDGKVTAVEVKENDSVNAGTVLAVIE